jgi:hypothetical protein
MELKIFISQALQDIIGGVDHAQKRIVYGEIVPRLDEKTGEVKNGEVDVEFELNITHDDKGRLIVVTPPLPPNTGKMKFKVPVKLPKERRCSIFFHCVNKLRLCCVRRKNRPARLTATEAAGGETTPPPTANQGGGTQSAEQAQQSKERKRSYWGFD